MKTAFFIIFFFGIFIPFVMMLFTLLDHDDD